LIIIKEHGSFDEAGEENCKFGICTTRSLKEIMELMLDLDQTLMIG
jgi:hypothetical protein